MQTKLNNLSLAKKLALLAGVLIACLAIVGVVSIKNLGSVNAIGGSVYKDRVVPLNDLSQARALLGDIDSQVLRSFAASASDDDFAGIAADDAKKIDALIAKYAATKLVKAEQDGLAAFRKSWSTYKEVFPRLQAHGAAGRRDEAGALYFSKAAPLYAEVDGALATLSKVNVDVAAESNRDIASTYSSSKTTTIVLLLVAIAFGLAIAVLVTRALRKSVTEVLDRLGMLQTHCSTDLANGLVAMADGDLTNTITPVTPLIDNPGTDEIGQIAVAVNGIRNRTVESVEAYNAMTEKLRGIVGDMAQSAGQVSSASQQMAATSEETGKAVGEIAAAVGEVAQGAERQVRGVDSVRAASEQTTSAARTSAGQAQEAAEVADQARLSTREGVSAAEQANEAMAAVRGSSQSAARAIRELADKSEQIGAIVETITGIADQTNLLALNAAIEAARAGEQGRGFAVVAEEVRKLAEESQKAAGEIGSLIGTIQDETGRAVEVVEDGARRTEDGAVIVEQTREAFERIGLAVEDMNERISHIAGAAEQISAETARMQNDIGEVAAVAEQSSASAEQVSASTQQTSASTQEIAASAQELASTAAQLEQLVQQFKVTA